MMNWMASTVVFMSLCLAACAENKSPRMSFDTSADVQPPQRCKPLDATYNHYSERELLDCKHLASMGSAEAAFIVGKYLRETGKSDGVTWFDMAAKQGHPAALYFLFDIYRLGGPIPKNGAKSEEYLAKAVEMKVEWAVLMDAHRNEAHDPVRSFDTYLGLARNGNCFAQTKVARSYFKGDITAQNLTQAYFWSMIARTHSGGKSDYHVDTNLFDEVAGDYPTKEAAERAKEAGERLQRSMAHYYYFGRGADCSIFAINSNLRHLPLLEKSLPEESIQIAQAAATDWRNGQHEPLLPPPTGDGLQALAVSAAHAHSDNKSAAAITGGRGRREGTVPSQKASLAVPPVIAVQPTLRVATDTVEISGRVSGGTLAALTVDGKSAPFSRDGSFSFHRAVVVGESDIRLTAVNEWGQSAETIIKVTRTIPTSAEIAFSPLDSHRFRGQARPNAIALIIGIEQYKSVPPAEFAENDARSFYDYAINALGVPASRVKLLTGGDAQRVDVEAAILTWLKPQVVKGQTEVFVFFSGHGLASDDGKDLYLLPQDGNRALLDRSALRRKELIEMIVESGAKSATLFLDTCYSGGTRGKETLVSSARPILVAAKEQAVPPNVTILAAAGNDQLSSSLVAAKHGLFSYFLMKGLEGEAAGSDHTITAAKLEAYLADHIPPEAAKLGRTQSPQLIGDGGRVISSW